MTYIFSRIDSSIQESKTLSIVYFTCKENFWLFILRSKRRNQIHKQFFSNILRNHNLSTSKVPFLPPFRNINLRWPIHPSPIIININLFLKKGRFHLSLNHLDHLFLRHLLRLISLLPSHRTK